MAEKVSMANPLFKRAVNPRVGVTAAGGTAGYALAQIIVELVNKAGAGLSDEFQTSLGVLLLLGFGMFSGWIVRDKDDVVYREGRRDV